MLDRSMCVMKVSIVANSFVLPSHIEFTQRRQTADVRLVRHPIDDRFRSGCRAGGAQVALDRFKAQQATFVLSIMLISPLDPGCSGAPLLRRRQSGPIEWCVRLRRE